MHACPIHYWWNQEYGGNQYIIHMYMYIDNHGASLRLNTLYIVCVLKVHDVKKRLIMKRRDDGKKKEQAKT